MFLTATIFQPLVTVFEAALKFAHNSVGLPWGWSIVVLTVVIRAIMIPLTFKQFHSMQKMQRLSPELKRLQAKYKEDKQRQQQEMMALYKEHGVNPFASCLPLVAQLPVFIGLYYTLRADLRPAICPGIEKTYQQKYALAHNISLHAAAGHTTPCGPHGGAGFLFISDLTNKTTGITLIVLIVLYVGTQLLSQILMSTPQMDPMQRRMMMLLPLVFVFIMIGLPTGVMVYWITTNTWTILQQYFVRKRLGPMTPLVAADSGASSGGGGPPSKGGGGGGSGRNGGPNGNAGGGIGALLRGKPKQEAEPVGAATAQKRATAPPPPPRKKKKRSGRRR